jgi:hypothetical protein
MYQAKSAGSPSVLMLAFAFVWGTALVYVAVDLPLFVGVRVVESLRGVKEDPAPHLADLRRKKEFADATMERLKHLPPSAANYESMAEAFRAQEQPFF